MPNELYVGMAKDGGRYGSVNLLKVDEMCFNQDSRSVGNSLGLRQRNSHFVLFGLFVRVN
jgi:hypothetical protein